MEMNQLNPTCIELDHEYKNDKDFCHIIWRPYYYGPYTLNDPYDRLFNGLHAILIFSKTDRVD